MLANCDGSAFWYNCEPPVNRSANTAMVENFKMAAELETLLSSYTSETPERYSFILFDCLESRQLLQDHVSIESHLIVVFCK